MIEYAIKVRYVKLNALPKIFLTSPQTQCDIKEVVGETPCDIVMITKLSLA